MRTASPTLLALMASGQFYKADLYTFQLIGGQVIRYTDFDMPLIVGGNLYQSVPQNGLLFKRTSFKFQTGMTVPTMAVNVFADASKTMLAVNFLQFLSNGGLDGATIRLGHMLMATPGDTSAGELRMFPGIVTDAQAGRTTAIINVAAWTKKLNRQIPTNVYQAGCMHALYDAGCTVSRAAQAIAGVVGASTHQLAFISNLSTADGWFTQGTVTFTSGVNNGLSVTVSSYASSAFVLANPLPQACAPGDTFTAYPGCDHTSATCASKFGNAANFRGTPFVPVAETAQ